MSVVNHVTRVWGSQISGKPIQPGEKKSYWRKKAPSTVQVSNPEIESVISKLHYRVTALIFLACCVLVTAVEYIGNGINIACVQDGKTLEQ